jgi:UDP-2-acetamido-3-amino-2,3-dideoxy-glucuronate N-acetyltransferase
MKKESQPQSSKSRSARVARVAVAGFGYWGKNLTRNFHQLGALAAICENAPANIEQFKSQYPDVPVITDFDQLLRDDSIEAVVIATPAETHAKLAEKALRAGKDVFVEKPLSLDIATGRGLVTLARERKRILMVGHLLWYHPAITKLKELITAGELGRIEYIYSNRLNLGKIRREENILWSFAPHDISVILGLLNEMPNKVSAQGGNYLSEQIADVTVSCLSFASGVRAHVFVSWLHPFKEQKLVIVGDKKMAVFNDVETEKKLLLYPHSIEWKGQIPVAEKADAQVVPIQIEEPLRAECQHFLDCVRDRCTPRTDGEEALRVLSVLQMCQKALDTKDHVHLEDVNPVTEKPASYKAHASAFIDKDVAIGDGTTIWHVSHVLSGSKIGKNCRIGQNVVIGPKAVVGDNVKIQNNVSVYEGVTLENDVFCGPSMVFTNVFNPRSEVPRMKELKKTLVRKGATLGANCTVVCGIEIGQYAFIGAGAVVTKSVPDYALVVGNPARQTGWMCRCGEKLAVKKGKGQCASCKARYEEKKGTLRAL